MTNITDVVLAIKQLHDVGTITESMRNYLIEGVESHLREDDIQLKKPVFKIILQRTRESRISLPDHVRMEIIASNEGEALTKARAIEPQALDGFYNYTVVTIQELRDE